MVKYNKKDRGNCVGESTANDFPLQETTTRPHTQLRVLLRIAEVTSLILANGAIARIANIISIHLQHRRITGVTDRFAIAIHMTNRTVT